MDMTDNKICVNNENYVESEENYLKKITVLLDKLGYDKVIYFELDKTSSDRFCNKHELIDETGFMLPVSVSVCSLYTYCLLGIKKQPSVEYGQVEENAKKYLAYLKDIVNIIYEIQKNNINTDVFMDKIINYISNTNFYYAISYLWFNLKDFINYHEKKIIKDKIYTIIKNYLKKGESNDNFGGISVQFLIDPDLFCLFDEKEMNCILMHRDFWNFGMIANNEIDPEKIIIKSVDLFKLFPNFKFHIYLSKISITNIVELFETKKLENLQEIYKCRIKKVTPKKIDTQECMGSHMFGDMRQSSRMRCADDKNYFEILEEYWKYIY